MTELVPVRPTEAARALRAASVAEALQVVVGRLIPPTHGGAPVQVVTVMVTDYGGHGREEAAAQVWADWTAHLPGVLVQVVHAGDGWEPVW